MGAFEYTALDTTGRQRKGVLEADTARQIRQQLREQGLAPLTVVEVQQRESKQKTTGFSLRRGVSPADMALMTRQLATLVRAGTPVDEALQAVSKQTEKPRVANILLGVRSKIKEGHSLAAAMADFPGVFSDLYRATVSAGEQSGHLEGVLERLADYTETRHAMQQKFQLALIYPALIALVSVAVVIGLLGFVVPKVVGVFENLGQELPLLTRMLIALSEFIQVAWPYLLILLLAAIGGMVYTLRHEGPKRRLHLFLLRVPLVSRLVRGMNAARFARTFSILVGSGVPALQAMSISAEVVSNLPMRSAVEEAAQRVREGGAIHRALDASGFFPPMTVHLIASGEASGKLDQMLERAATAQEREMETLLAMLLGIFEPFMILFMGGMVLVIVLAILLPIFDLNQLVK
ncbi:MAG: type II secretion system inner membrane protein GspF [Gammaproteobacteria bacterium]|nr:type II secretion system inner membrane protein GspF [Gammaproteobacteria bacterium]